MPSASLATGAGRSAVAPLNNLHLAELLPVIRISSVPLLPRGQWGQMKFRPSPRLSNSGGVGCRSQLRVSGTTWIGVPTQSASQDVPPAIDGAERIWARIIGVHGVALPRPGLGFGHGPISVTRLGTRVRGDPFPLDRMTQRVAFERGCGAMQRRSVKFVRIGATCALVSFAITSCGSSAPSGAQPITSTVTVSSMATTTATETATTTVTAAPATR